jgi:hypothetical protein
MPKKETEFKEMEQARAKLSEVQGQLQKNINRQGEIQAARQDRQAAADDILLRATAVLNGDKPVADLQAEAAELDKLHAEEKVLRRAARIQAGRLDELVLVASRAEYARRRPEVVDHIRQIILSIYAYKAACEDYEKLQAEFRAKGLRDMVPTFA